MIDFSLYYLSHAIRLNHLLLLLSDGGKQKRAANISFDQKIQHLTLRGLTLLISELAAVHNFLKIYERFKLVATNWLSKFKISSESTRNFQLLHGFHER